MDYRGQRNTTAYSVLILIAASALMLIATLARGDLIYRLGLQPATWRETPWTIVTNLFIHGGIWHIASNMLTLYFFGTFLSALVGEARFLSIYFTGGIAGNLVFILFAPANSIAIGASGAVFAVGGALVMMKPKLRVTVFPIPAPIPLWVALLGGFVIVSILPGIAWQAHLGGVVIGLIMGYLFRKQQRLVLF